MYISFFPKIINGPIVQYKQISDQLQYRDLEIKKVAQGARRFILGLAKKVLIADIIARTINPCFNLSSPDFSTGIAWFLLIGYTIQIYFDFSGYSDMALGLAGMMGFTFGENFNYPYIAESITDFWRRWHISLSNWVREYIFIPLEFKRRKSKFFRQQIDFLITFLVTGLWHGLTPNFIIWGAIHGLAMGAESGFFAKMLKRVWKPLQHVYTLAIVMLGWIFFRPATTSYSIKFLGRLVGLGSSVPIIPYNMTAPLPIIDTSVWIAIGLGILLSTPLLSNLLKGFQKKRNPSQKGIVQLIQDGFTLILFLLSVASIASSGYVGSIYGNF
jgi:alginate O-acetyltransferase complex protein AlgI